MAVPLFTNSTLMISQLGSPVSLIRMRKLNYVLKHMATEYPTIRVVAVVEPDSLANLVTNLSDPKYVHTFQPCPIFNLAHWTPL